MSRATYSGIVSRMAGCFVCGKQWQAKNALAVAARHHDATGHSTWCEQVISTRFGEYPETEPRDIPATP